MAVLQRTRTCDRPSEDGEAEATRGPPRAGGHAGSLRPVSVVTRGVALGAGLLEDDESRASKDG